jgi:hypothetical protein
VAASWPTDFWFSFTLLVSCLAVSGSYAQTRNPLRESPTTWPGGVRARLSDESWPGADNAGDEAFRLVSDQEDLPPIAPPMRSPEDFLRADEQPPRWPGRSAPRQSATKTFDPAFLPPQDPDFEAWEQADDLRFPRRAHRFTGWGQPLHGTSWLNRPFYVGAYLGQAFWDDPVFDVQQNNAALAGLRLGWDFDYYWGLEGRFAYSNPNLTPIGTSSVTGTGRDYFVDVALIWYPTGDSRWRPYLSAGLGAATYRFQYNGVGLHDTGLEIPLSFGMKYYLARWASLRWEFQYAPTIGTERLDPMNNLAIGLGAEIRFGGSPRSYFPWTGNTAYW